MVELMINGKTVGVFSDDQAARLWLAAMYPDGTSWQMHPLGTFLESDLEEEGE